MTHEELEAIRQRAAAAAAYCAARDPAHVDKVRHTPWNYPVAASAIDATALLAYIDELHSIVHDLRQEPGYALGRQDVLREVLNVLGKVPVTWNANHTKAVADPQSLAIVLDLIECLGPAAPHLAPDDLRRENEALRATLREVLHYFDPTRVLPFDGQRCGDMITQAHRLLGEDV